MIEHMGIHNKGDLYLSEIIESIKKTPDFTKAGAIGVFVGVVRGKTNRGVAVKKMRLEAYEEEANKILKSICKDLQKRTGVIDVQIHHLVGEFTPSEEVVYVVVVGAHRTNVFPILSEAVERYKKEAPIWKKEYLENGKSYWVSEPH